MKAIGLRDLPRALQRNVAVLVLLTSASCGGGGRGEGSAGSRGEGPASISLETQYTFSASTLELEPVVDVISTFFANGAQSIEVFASATNTNVGISSVESRVVGPDFIVEIEFRLPASLGPGVYRDTVTIRGCYDTQCTRHVLDSPFSTEIQFTVTGPDPNSQVSLLDTSPHIVTAGEEPFALTAIGTGFSPSSVVLWNGGARPTTFLSATRLLAQISAEDVATEGSAQVSVKASASSGESTTTNELTIVRRAESATAMQINPAHSGTIEFADVILPPPLRWQVSMPGETRYPIVADGKVIIASGTEIRALDQVDGTVVWVRDSLAGGAALAYDNGIVFAVSRAESSDETTLQAFNANTGAEEWTFSETDLILRGTPTATQDHVYILGSIESESSVYAFQQASGQIDWSRRIRTDSANAVAVGPEGVFASFVCDTYAFLPTNGFRVWTQSTGCRSSGAARNAAVLDRGVVYAPDVGAGGDGRILRAQTGEILGTYDTNRLPVLTEQYALVFTSGNRRLSAWSRESGTIRWSFEDVDGLTLPIVVNEYVFVGSRFGAIYSLDLATGQIVWESNIGQRISLSTDIRGTSLEAGLAAGDGLLIVPGVDTLSVYDLSANP